MFKAESFTILENILRMQRIYTLELSIKVKAKSETQEKTMPRVRRSRYGSIRAVDCVNPEKRLKTAGKIENPDFAIKFKNQMHFYDKRGVCT